MVLKLSNLSVFGDTEMTAWTYSKRVRGGLESEHLDIIGEDEHRDDRDTAMRVGNR